MAAQKDGPATSLEKTSPGSGSGSGRPWSQSHFQSKFSQAVGDAGLRGYVFHGLRKTATSMLVEAGCEDREAQAITGHKTVEMITLYASGVRQKKLADRTIRKMEGWRQ